MRQHRDKIGVGDPVEVIAADLKSFEGWEYDGSRGKVARLEIEAGREVAVVKIEGNRAGIKHFPVTALKKL